MELRDFQVGKTYRMVEEDFQDPLDESQVTPGAIKVRRVLEPASLTNTRVTDGSRLSATEIEELRTFLRVQDPVTGRVHFQHPSTLQQAELLGEGRPEAMKSRSTIKGFYSNG